MIPITALVAAEITCDTKLRSIPKCEPNSGRTNNVIDGRSGGAHTKPKRGAHTSKRKCNCNGKQADKNHHPVRLKSGKLSCQYIRK